MGHRFLEIESKWQAYWQKNKSFAAKNDTSLPKFYCLDMFPYPSGAGLHVGHPLGYIASDIYARYKRLKGFNVLHPMGYDAFGLPTEQYAILTGQHPALTTEKNTARYRSQLDRIGLSYDWDREVQTCDPKYYRHTQWMFIELFESWFDKSINKARPLVELKQIFEQKGNLALSAADNCVTEFDAATWNGFSHQQQETLLLNYRLAYLADSKVNWCPHLGTVLANDEVKDGLSERGGHPVEQKVMQQWLLRVSAYSQRLLDGLETVEWSDSLKEIQRNWIGRSVGAEVLFAVDSMDLSLEVFTTRPDTIFGVTFMVLAPESELVDKLTIDANRAEMEEYLKKSSLKTEMDRMSETKLVSGTFTGSYCINPFSGDRIPIWVADYVLAGYGTGAIMAVPAHDSRDYAFAKKYQLKITEVLAGGDIAKEAFVSKSGKLVNSDFLNGLDGHEAIKKAIEQIVKKNIGTKKTNYRLRDAIFSRQRYWGEPIPIYYKNGIPYAMDKSELPLVLPDVDQYLPTAAGDPPLGRAKNWVNKDGHPLELTTMPGFAGSSAYYLRYTDPHNSDALVSNEANEYWDNVDLYVGGSEHATGHLIYSRFFNKFLYDRGFIKSDEPFKKLINQGMIQGQSQFVYRIKGSQQFVSYNLKEKYDVQTIHVDVNIVHNGELDLAAFKSHRDEYKNSEFILEDGKYLTGSATEKMSKSLYNVVNPDDVIEKYGADTLRLYEMFLGPIEQSKPWSTSGIEGVFRFLNKAWRQCFDEEATLILADNAPSADELKVIHTAILKVTESIETFSHNTAVSSLMICLNDLQKIKSHNLLVMQDFVLLLAPLAPHLAEEMWHKLGNKQDLSHATFPICNEKYLVESTHKYPISLNGKLKFVKEMSLDFSKTDLEKAVLADAKTVAFLEGKKIMKVIVVPKKIVNIVAK